MAVKAIPQDTVPFLGSMLIPLRESGGGVMPPRRAVPRVPQVRKIGLLGSHTGSLADCPWDDPSWELWGHASSRAYYKRELDCYFDLHPKSRWNRAGKKTRQYPNWLAVNTVPIYMQEKFKEVPASIRYPKERILQEFDRWIPRRYYANQVAWMIALALTEGVTHIGLWGISYSSMSEYNIQRGSCEAWLFFAAGRGVQIVLPEQCTLLREPATLYGYESHDENGDLFPEYQAKVWKIKGSELTPILPGETPELAKPPAVLVDEIAEEEERHPRPAWTLERKQGVA